MRADFVHRRGFTLIEVLVALAIIALGLAGVFGQLSQTAAAASRLRDKTLASWVALNEITNLRISGAFPRVGTSSGDAEMGNTKWHWEMTVSDADEQKLFRRAEVAVSLADKPDRPVAVISGFLAESAKPTASTHWVSGTGGPGEGPPPPGTNPPPATPPPTAAPPTATPPPAEQPE